MCKALTTRPRGRLASFASWTIPGLPSNIQQLPLNCMVILLIFRTLDFLTSWVLQFSSPIWAESWCRDHGFYVGNSEGGRTGWRSWILAAETTAMGRNPTMIQHDATLHSHGQFYSNIIMFFLVAQFWSISTHIIISRANFSPLPSTTDHHRRRHLQKQGGYLMEGYDSICNL